MASQIDKMFSSGQGSRIDPPKTTGAPLKDREGNDIDLSPNEEDVKAAGRDRQMKRQIDRQIRRAARRGGVKLALELMSKRKEVYGTSSPDSATISSYERNRDQDLAMAADKKRKMLLVGGAIDPSVKRTDDPDAKQGGAGLILEQAGSKETAQQGSENSDTLDYKTDRDGPYSDKITTSDGQKSSNAKKESADAIASKADKPVEKPVEEKLKENEFEKVSRQAREAGVDEGFEASLEYDQLIGEPDEKLPSQKSRLDELRDMSRTDDVIAKNKEISDQSPQRREGEEGLTIEELTEKRRAEYDAPEARAKRELEIRDHIDDLLRPSKEKFAERQAARDAERQIDMRRSTASDVAFAALSGREQALQLVDIDNIKGNKPSIIGVNYSVGRQFRDFDPNATLQERSKKIMPSDAEMAGKSPAEIKEMVKTNIKNYEKAGSTFRSVLAGGEKPSQKRKKDGRVYNQGSISSWEQSIKKKMSIANKTIATTPASDVGAVRAQREEILSLVNTTGFDPTHMLWPNANPEFVNQIQEVLSAKNKVKSEVERKQKDAEEVKSALSGVGGNTI